MTEPKPIVTISIVRWGFYTKHYNVTIRGPESDVLKAFNTPREAEAFVRTTLGACFPRTRYQYVNALGGPVPTAWLPINADAQVDKAGM